MTRYNTSFLVEEKEISINSPSYFIADIAANHDGDLERAKELIWKAKEAGADCAKFQHFKAQDIVSDFGFSSMTDQMSHQATWEKSVYDIYDQYHTKRDWTDTLKQTCVDADIHFMTTPYDFEAIDTFAELVPAYKIGSGDITFSAAVERISKINKPVLLATGASDLQDTIQAVNLVLESNPNLCLMQCNTNYTGNIENFRNVNLNVLRTFAIKWPGLPLGLSDHTPGHSAVLGAITLGARVIEKHFTDDNNRVGPDHSFALNPKTWRNMVDASRELEYALGDGVKRIEDNELDTVVIQRRSLRATRDLTAGTTLSADDFEALRPCPTDAIDPRHYKKLVGQTLGTDKVKGQEFYWNDLTS